MNCSALEARIGEAEADYAQVVSANLRMLYFIRDQGLSLPGTAELRRIYPLGHLTWLKEDVEKRGSSTRRYAALNPRSEIFPPSSETASSPETAPADDGAPTTSKPESWPSAKSSEPLAGSLEGGA